MADKIDSKKDDMFELQSSIRLLTAAIKDYMAGTKDNTAAAEEENKSRKEAREKLDKENEGRDSAKKSLDNYKTATDKAKNSLEKFGSELLKAGEAGIKFASAIGTSATKGVELELKNRLTLAGQLLNFNTNLAVTSAQLQSAQKSFADVFTGAAAGMEINSETSREFASSLKRAFGSEFEATPEAMRAFIDMGMSSVEEMTAFRQATGRAGLSTAQLTSLYNKNTLSFMLYGNSFAKAAIEAQRLGINLASIQAAQESLVTNLDGTIDTVAQINQIGGQIDFGNLVRIAETEGPDALMRYVRATVPEYLMQSASTRALFKQLGISVEDYIRSGNRQRDAAEELETQFTKAGDGAENFVSKLLAAGTRVYGLVTGTFLGITVSGLVATKALFSLAASARAAAIANGGAAALVGSTMKLLLPIAGILAGGALTAYGTSLAKEGKASGFLAGAAGGAMLGASIGFMAPVPGAALVGGLLGAMGGTLTTAIMANDMYSAGYGSRTLVTPTGAYALNNADDIIAGTNLFPKGSLRAGTDNSGLVRKVDELISVISNANTTINVGGNIQTVPRMNLVGVYSRNEVR